MLSTELVVGIVASFLSAVFGVVFALWYESHGSPHLVIRPVEASDKIRQKGIRAKFL